MKYVYGCINVFLGVSRRIDGGSDHRMFVSGSSELVSKQNKCVFLYARFWVSSTIQDCFHMCLSYAITSVSRWLEQT